MARGSRSGNKPEYPMSSAMQEFRFEVAQELGLSHRIPGPGGKASMLPGGEGFTKTDHGNRGPFKP